MSWKFTDLVPLYKAVDKFHVANLPVGKVGSRVFVSIGPGGKGSEYLTLTPDDALRLARYLIVEAHKSIEASETVPPAPKKK